MKILFVDESYDYFNHFAIVIGDIENQKTGKHGWYKIINAYEITEFGKTDSIEVLTESEIYFYENRKALKNFFDKLFGGEYKLK